jgi:hypothetical protein
MRFVSCPPSLPRAARHSAVAGLVIALGMSLAACSSANQAQNQNAAYAGAQPPVPAPSRQAAYEPAAGDPIKDAPIEPRRAPIAQPDDPNEPFSPNYGGQRTTPKAVVSDYEVKTHDPEPDQQPASMRLPAPSRAYFKTVTATASAD